MITEKSNEGMKRAFEKTIYKYTEIPKYSLRGKFGVYIHVPFCYSKCSFCPFYKEIYSDSSKNNYLEAIKSEIKRKDFTGEATWIYFGGGTPNTLNVEDLAEIVTLLKSKVSISSMGMELLPSVVTEDYLKGISNLGFNKVSVGVESMEQSVISPTGRKMVAEDNISFIISKAKELGMFINADLMVGLPNQKSDLFINDIKKLAKMQPSQITIYPFMIIRGLKSEPGEPSEKQFKLIEDAFEILKEYGYKRAGIWTFTIEDDIYDSSRDELIEDYIGFGPAAFSTYGDWKIVNPELSVYLYNDKNHKEMGLVAPKDAGSDEWRRFSRMLYDMKIESSDNLPFFIKTYLFILKISGYIKNNKLTDKGKMFSHSLTKTVVESLPYPLQNTKAVENYDEYTSYKKIAGEYLASEKAYSCR